VKLTITHRTRLVALALAALAAGCGGDGGDDEPAASAGAGPVAVELQLNWKPEPQFGGFYAAELSGAYARHGLAVAIRPGGASAPTVDMLGAGTVPFAITSGDEIVRARANGNLLVGLYAAYQTNPQGIMTRAERGFSTLADVFAHPGTLAMERGLPYSTFLERKYGFDRLRIVPSPFGDLSLYRTDPTYSMQCFVTAEPLQASKIGIEPKTFLIAESGYNPYTTVLTTSERFLAANRATVEAMVAAVREGWRSYLDDPAPTNELMHGLNPTMDLDTFAGSAEAQRPLVVGETAATATSGADGGDGAPLGAMTLERWRTLVDQLVELGIVPASSVAPEECFVDLGGPR
jgi:NitT/TauT family transport system substrate-binding protein